MKTSSWPFVADSFSSVLPDDLPAFIQTGVTHSLGRVVSIIDSRAETRIDAFDRYDGYTAFCKCLRNPCDKRANGGIFENICNKCDLAVAKKMSKTPFTNGDNVSTPVHYRCYMGLEEIAIMIRIDHLPVMVVSGQFMPSEGINDLLALISCMGERPPSIHEVSPQLWKSLQTFGFPTTFWTQTKLTESEKAHLLDHALLLKPCPDEFDSSFLAEAKRIANIGQDYYELARTKVEGLLLQQAAEAASKLDMSSTSVLWSSVSNALEALINALNIRYAVFFSGSTESDTILLARASAGLIPKGFNNFLFPHFNWRKADLRTQDKRDTREQILDWETIKLNDRDRLIKGLRGIGPSFNDNSGIIPVRLPSGPLGLLIIGPHKDGVDLLSHEEILLKVCRDFCTRVLTMQLARIFQVERSEWEKTARITGHRIRASIQGINSQLNTITAEVNGLPGFTKAIRAEAEKDLEEHFKKLNEVSIAAESTIPGAVDVKIAQRELVSLYDLIHAAKADQQTIADENNIEIQVSDDIAKYAPVYVNQTLMRFALINLINNGLKYSYQKSENKERVFRINRPLFHDEYDDIRVEFENFGLGIKDIDKDRIFEWGVRLVEGGSSFKETYGRGFGLWEVKRIAEGHGGKVLLRSAHHTGNPVDDRNINQCVTVFTLCLPKG